MATRTPGPGRSASGTKAARRFGGAGLALVASVGLLTMVAAPVAAHDPDHRGTHVPNLYAEHDLVSDTGANGTVMDPNLVNGWGITAGPTTPWWVADNGTDKSTLYNGTGGILPIVVNVPSAPTGTVFNASTTEFVITGGGVSGAARFLFATEGGQILGWNAAVPGSPVPSNQAFVGATRPGAIYKGLAIGSAGGKDYLYATDFHHGRVDVYDSTFTLQKWAHAFRDRHLPEHYAPFGIQNLNGLIFVTYARQDADKADEIAGHGRGFVDVFTTAGKLLGRVASRGDLNAPWGLAWAPSNFGRFSGDLLVGNFGDGRMTAYAWTKHGWREQGQLRSADHKAISIDGLWGIGFGNGAASGPTNTLYFAAGPDDEAHGLFGSITAP
jgi:uncharacterized protein (TIGR03118 family)